ncbi:hypothetical protein EPN52_14525 [bacterium]|nr:MAG: hypothetical protein EPN52_14525 [bacterium]
MSVETIVAELHRLRETQSEGRVMGATASTSTLVVCAAGAGELAVLSESARRMAIAHGARLLLLDAGAGGSAARVCAFCGRAGGETVCCEEIALPIDAGRPASVIADVEELALPGLPCYLWWVGGELDGALLRGLGALARRIVVDTSRCSDPAASLVALDAILSRQPHAQLWDLAWLRVAPWREMAARLFDDPTRAGALTHIEAIEVESGSLAEAALLAAWIGVQLNYEISEPARSFRTGSGATVTFSHLSGGAPGEVRMVRLHAAGATYSAHVEGDCGVRLSVESEGERRSRCEPMLERSLEDVVAGALFGLGGDPGFSRALGLTARLLRA